MKHLPLFIVASFVLLSCSRTPVANPDPNHTHADFAVWVDGKQLDFSGPEFMSGTSDEKDPDHTKHDKYLHLHDGNGHVIHRHKPGLTFGDFLESLGFTFVLKDGQHCVTVPERGEICSDGYFSWATYINGVEIGSDCQGYQGISAMHRVRCDYLPPNRIQDVEQLWDYDFQDGDKILFIFKDKTDPDIRSKALKSLTDDACRYSKTCPWRGAPPTENCIADPEVPCQ